MMESLLSVIIPLIYFRKDQNNITQKFHMPLLPTP